MTTKKSNQEKDWGLPPHGDRKIFSRQSKLLREGEEENKQINKETTKGDREQLRMCEVSFPRKPGDPLLYLPSQTVIIHTQDRETVRIPRIFSREKEIKGITGLIFLTQNKIPEKQTYDHYVRTF